MLCLDFPIVDSNYFAVFHTCTPFVVNKKPFAADSKKGYAGMKDTSYTYFASTHKARNRSAESASVIFTMPYSGEGKAPLSI